MCCIRVQNTHIWNWTVSLECLCIFTNLETNCLHWLFFFFLLLLFLPFHHSLFLLICKNFLDFAHREIHVVRTQTGGTTRLILCFNTKIQIKYSIFYIQQRLSCKAWVLPTMLVHTSYTRRAILTLATGGSSFQTNKITKERHLSLSFLLYPHGADIYIY